ncbi:MAG: oxygenase MpaB family protein [Myxococcota bacterium]
MAVSREELEGYLARIASEVCDPRGGIHGPGSMSWRLSRESVLFLGGGRAALLQLAHPYVAHAVDQHSQTRKDPAGRFQRTFEHVYAMVFGDLPHAFESARRVHRIHTHITGPIDEAVGPYAHGHRYEANDEQALLWVFATLTETSMLVYDRVVKPLSDAERGRYYEESKRFAWLFGIPDRVLPADHLAFARYCDAMYASDTLTVGRPAADIGRFLMAAPTPALEPAMRWYRIMTAGFLPPRLAEAYGLPFGRAERRVFDASLALIRRTYPLLPRRLRHIPAYVEARRRLQGQEGPDRFGRTLERMLQRGMRAARS